MAFEESIELVKGVTSGHKMAVLDRRICHPRKKRSGEKRMEHGVENVELLLSVLCNHNPLLHMFT